MKKKVKKNSDNFVYLKIFLVFVIFAFLISTFFKFITLISESKFTDTYFNLLIASKKNYITSINKKEGSVSILEIPQIDKDIIKGKKNGLSLYLGMPVDAVMIDRNNTFIYPENYWSLNNFLHITLSNNNSFELYDLNKLDVLKIFIASYFIDSSKYKIESISNLDKLFDDQEIQTKVYDLFRDKDIINEKVSIEVVNTSGISGVGNRVAQMLKNIGYNVVLITSQEKNLQSKMVYRIEKNYTIERLSRIFRIPIDFRTEVAVTNVSIILGKDYIEKNMKLN